MLVKVQAPLITIASFYHSCTHGYMNKHVSTHIIQLFYFQNTYMCTHADQLQVIHNDYYTHYSINYMYTSQMQLDTQ